METNPVLALHSNWQNGIISKTSDGLGSEPKAVGDNQPAWQVICYIIAQVYNFFNICTFAQIQQSTNCLQSAAQVVIT
jgi:hypothetical protein